MNQNGRHRDPHSSKPELAAAWTQAEVEGMAALLAGYAVEGNGLAHFFYDEREVPVYGPCVCCGATLRVDRLDLIAEHLRICPKFKRRHMRLVA